MARGLYGSSVSVNRLELRVDDEGMNEWNMDDLLAWPPTVMIVYLCGACAIDFHHLFFIMLH